MAAQDQIPVGVMTSLELESDSDLDLSCDLDGIVHAGEEDAGVSGYDDVVSTGLAPLDTLLHGGLAVGTTHLIISQAGDEGELLVMHMAAAVPSTVILCDRSQATIERAWEPFVDLDDIEFTRDASGEFQDRIIIENFTARCDDVGFATALGALKDLIQQTHDSGRTTIVHVLADGHTSKEMARMRSLVDGVMELDGHCPMVLQIPKMRGLLVDVKCASMRRGPSGLMVESVRRVM